MQKVCIIHTYTKEIGIASGAPSPESSLQHSPSPPCWIYLRFPWKNCSRRQIF